MIYRITTGTVGSQVTCPESIAELIDPCTCVREVLKELWRFSQVESEEIEIEITGYERSVYDRISHRNGLFVLKEGT